MSRTSVIYKPLMVKLAALMDAWQDADSEYVFTVGTKPKPFRKRFTQPKKSIPIGQFPCYFYYVKKSDLDWKSLRRRIMGTISGRVTFYKRIWDTKKEDQTEDLYFWAEELSKLVEANRRWDGACSDGVQDTNFSSVEFDYAAFGEEMFFLADCDIEFLVYVTLSG